MGDDFIDFYLDVEDYRNTCQENPEKILNVREIHFPNVSELNFPVIPALLVLSFLSPSAAFAADELGPVKSPSSVKEMLLAFTSLKVLIDPRVSRLQKGVLLGKYGCCSLAVVFGTVKEYFPKASTAHLALSACCAGSWTGYTLLHATYPKDTPI